MTHVTPTNISGLKDNLAAEIISNPSQKISGDILNVDLNDMIDVLAAHSNVAVGLYTCDTAASTAAKTVSVTDFAQVAGGAFKVKFTYANSASSPTLQMGDTSAKAIVFNGAPASDTNTWVAGEVVEFYYDPTYNSNAGGYIGRSSVVSVSQNTDTGHIDIKVGDETTPVASGKEVEELESQIKGENNTTIEPLESIECNIPKGAITAKISNNEELPTYFTLVFSDSNDNAIYTITTDYIIGGATKTYTFDADEDIAKISLTYDNNMIPLDLAVISSGFVAGQLSKINEEISTIQEDITDIKEQIEINADSAESLVLVANSAAINEDGDIIEDADEVNALWKIKVTPFCNYLLDNVRAIVRASGTYFKYAWYSSFEVINSGTFISGSSETAPFDEYITDTVTPPNGALALVVSIYVDLGSVKKAQNTTNSMEQVFFKRNIIEDAFLQSLRNIYNGTPRLLGTAYSLKDYGITPTVTGNSPYENKVSLSGLGWCYFGRFNPNNDEIIHIVFDVEDGLAIQQGGVLSVWVAKNFGSSGANQKHIADIEDVGHYDITIDPTYYRVHEGYSDTFYIWIYMVEGLIYRCDIDNLRIFSLPNKIPLTNIDGVDVGELMQSIDKSIGNISKDLYEEEYLISPNGSKFVLGVANDGTLKSIPVIPNKAAFFGNSLIAGNQFFGMDATNGDADFYARFNAYVLALNPNYTAARYSSVAWETIASLEDIADVVASTIANLTGDEDLIIMQGGDNTTDAQAISIMPTSSLALLAAMRAKCPNARICWAGIWYATPDKMACVRNACKRYGGIVAPIGDLNTPENRSAVNTIIDYGSGNSAESELENVTNLVENTATNITVTYTYDGLSYTQTIDVSSYSLNGTTLTYTGRYHISTVGAGHPGDRGMKAIANKILYSMGISDTEEAISLS